MSAKCAGCVVLAAATGSRMPIAHTAITVRRAITDGIIDTIIIRGCTITGIITAATGTIADPS